MQGITTLEEFDAIDEAVCVDGYLAGYRATPDYTRKERDYWHGYLNGQVDGKHVEISPAQSRLAQLVVQRSRTPATTEGA